MDRRLSRTNPTRSLHGHLFHARLRQSREMWLFLLFSVADVVLTAKLLLHGGHFESNPVARYVLNGWGLKGLVYFKFAAVAVVCVLAQVIAYKHAAIARKLLSFAVLLVAGVVTYSSVLVLRAAL